MTLATFFRFKVKIPGVSLDLTASDENQFTDKLTSADTALLGYYCMNLFEMKAYGGAFTTRERGMFGIHYVNSTSGALDTTWTSADYAAVESAVSTAWTAYAAAISTEVRLVEHRWYPYGPGYIGTKSAPIPPARVTTLGTPLAGSMSGAHVRQVGSTVTLRTTLRRHWGRFYLPLSSSNFATNGQLSSTSADSYAATARTMLTSPEASQGVSPVVYDKLRKQVYGVTAIEVDTVPDIQRRRRPRDPGYKKIYTS
jgi:hypothetical protein